MSRPTPRVYGMDRWPGLSHQGIRGNVLRACGCALSLTLLALTSSASALDGASLPEEYDRLLAAGCQPEQFDVATAIEARVLRNLPYARAGMQFASVDLTTLYASDGAWYRPVQSEVTLAEPDRRCVERLRRHEAKVRGQLPIAPAVERVLTADATVFWALRRHARFPNQYRDAWSSSGPSSWSWGFVDGAACGGDGSLEAAGDCAGLTVICSAEEATAMPHCEVVQSG